MRDFTISILKKSNSNKQLILFPFAGGYANSFLHFSSYLNLDMEILGINPPGHGPNNKEVLDSIEKMAEEYYLKLLPLLKERVFFLGYSMGGLVAYKVIEKLKQNKISPEKLVICASNPFHIKTGNSYENNKDFIEFLKPLGGITKEIEQDKEILEFFLPILRNDYIALENCVAPSSQMDVSIHIIFGDKDEYVSYENVKQWDRYFSLPPTYHLVHGGHMFINENIKDFSSILSSIFDLSRKAE